MRFLNEFYGFDLMAARAILYVVLSIVIAVMGTMNTLTTVFGIILAADILVLIVFKLIMYIKERQR